MLYSFFRLFINFKKLAVIILHKNSNALIIYSNVSWLNLASHLSRASCFLSQHAQCVVYFIVLYGFISGFICCPAPLLKFALKPSLHWSDFPLLCKRYSGFYTSTRVVNCWPKCEAMRRRSDVLLHKLCEVEIGFKRKPPQTKNL